MDYLNLIKNLTSEMKKGVQYKRIAQPIKIFIIIAMIPFIGSFVAAKVYFWMTNFFRKMVATPAEYLHDWLKGERDDIRPLTQAIMYLICLPFIFTLQVILALFSIHFYIQWFIIMILAYIITLGGIKWQPFITEVSFDEDTTEYDLKPGRLATTIYGIVALASLLMAIAMTCTNLIISIFWPPFLVIGGVLVSTFEVIYLVTMFIATPILFKRAPKKDE